VFGELLLERIWEKGFDRDFENLLNANDHEPVTNNTDLCLVKMATTYFVAERVNNGVLT
jgi:hypothetical protein